MERSTFTARSELPAIARDVYAWHLRPGAFERLTPPWERVEIVERPPRIEDGARVVLRVGVGPASLRWVARHEGFEDGRRFRDVQLDGPFRAWVHTHRFEPVGDAASALVDEIEYEPPLGALGRAAAGRAIAHRLRRMFAWRHAITRADLERHAEARGLPPLVVAVSGSHGLVGSAVVAFLRAGGHRVRRLVRGQPRGADEIRFEPAAGRIDAAELADVDAVVHLAGENVFGRWTEGKKRRIRASRVDGTRLLSETLAHLARRPRVLVSASAVGWYGDRGPATLDESAPPGDGFLAEVCRAWEAATAPAERAGVRVVRLRIGIVMSGAGGALRTMALPFRLGLGGRVGDGRQWMSWIALDDLVGLIHRALVRSDLAGPVNAVAPEPVTNAGLTRALGRVLGRPTPFPVPAPVVRAALGELAGELLGSQRVVPARAVAAGFRHRLPRIEDALAFELGRFAGRLPIPGFEPA